jgi:hypothetical protein
MLRDAVCAVVKVAVYTTLFILTVHCKIVVKCNNKSLANSSSSKHSSVAHLSESAVAHRGGVWPQQLQQLRLPSVRDLRWSTWRCSAYMFSPTPASSATKCPSCDVRCHQLTPDNPEFGFNSDHAVEVSPRLLPVQPLQSLIWSNQVSVGSYVSRSYVCAYSRTPLSSVSQILTFTLRAFLSSNY